MTPSGSGLLPAKSACIPLSRIAQFGLPRLSRRLYFNEPHFLTLGANWIRPDRKKCWWRVVVDQRAT